MEVVGTTPLTLIDELTNLKARKEALREETKQHELKIEREIENINKETKDLLGFCDGEPLTIDALVNIVKKVSECN